MRIDDSKYGARPLDEDHFDYHIWKAEGLDLGTPERDVAVEQAIQFAQKTLGSGWEFDHINHGTGVSPSTRERTWPQLVFRKAMSEPVLHREYRNYDVWSSPSKFALDGTYLRSIKIRNQQRTWTREIVYKDEPRYPTIEEAHAEGFKLARRIIDEAERNPYIL
jgi:hypothetical protein